MELLSDFISPVTKKAVTGTTDKDGKLVFDRLPLGEYKIVETKAPTLEDGTVYKLNKKETVIKILGNTEPGTAEIKNFKSTTWTPSTGTKGILPYVVIMAGAGAVAVNLYIKSKKEEDK